MDTCIDQDSDCKWQNQTFKHNFHKKRKLTKDLPSQVVKSSDWRFKSDAQHWIIKLRLGRGSRLTTLFILWRMLIPFLSFMLIWLKVAESDIWLSKASLKCTWIWWQMSSHQKLWPHYIIKLFNFKIFKMTTLTMG